MTAIRAAVLALAVAVFGLAGCNTVEGVGEDISSSARTVKNEVFSGD